ncbi:MAG TPA: prepilin-type N-terminal cleavage/methylation domain-containing protein [Candidatus Omnitrophica bacterium]|nr:prepilin-type N-terminal cleavage/methylation domain-containing protein [Candidatus Omnitrophota bacterium]
MTKKYRWLFKYFVSGRYRVKAGRFYITSFRCSALKGFTLTEVVIAAVIMSLTIGGLFSIFISSNRFVQRANRRLAAVNLAQDQIERRREFVREDTWTEANDNANLGTTGGTWNPGGWIAGPSVGAIAQSYRYWVEDDSSPGNPVPAAAGAAFPARRVFMQVQWTEPN